MNATYAQLDATAAAVMSNVFSGKRPSGTLMQMTTHGKRSGASGCAIKWINCAFFLRVRKENTKTKKRQQQMWDTKRLNF